MAFEELKIRYKYTLDNFVKAFKSLLPPGPLFRNLVGSWDDVIEASCEEFKRIEDRRVDLLNESVPGLSNEMLTDWEECILNRLEKPQPGDSLDLRQRTVQAKYYNATGSPNAEFYIQYALTIGVIITISKPDVFTPARCGVSVCGDLMQPEQGNYIWEVNVVSDPNDRIGIVIQHLLALKQSHTAIYYDGDVYL